MRIISLLPSATEIVCALGLEDSLVAITHECDYPFSVKTKPVITRSVLSEGLTSAEIDAAVRERLDGANSLYTIDQTLLAELAPDLILTQQLCAVCAVSYEDVLTAVRSLPKPPRVLNLEPTTLADVLGTIMQVGQSTGREGQAAVLTAELRARVEHVRVLADRAGTRPRTVILEWIDPLFGGGHWDPELVQIAGGCDLVGSLHRPSTQISWDTVREFAPEVLVVAQCGFGVARTLEDMPTLEGLPGYADLPAVQAGRVFVVNGSDYFSRPGPRLIDSLELLASLLHPKLFGPPAFSEERVVCRKQAYCREPNLPKTR